MDQALEWLTSPDPPLFAPLVLFLFFCGILLAGNNKTWRAIRYPATWVHEAGHAIMALLSGRRVEGIRVRANSSGETVHAGPLRKLDLMVVAGSGYPAPAALGAGLLFLLLTGSSRWGILLCLFIVILLSVFQRSVIGVGTSVLFIIVLVGLIVAPQLLAVIVLAVLAGIFWIASPKTIIELHRIRQQRKTTGESEHSDADRLAELSHIPAVFWEIFFYLMSLSFLILALWVGYPFEG